MTVALATPNGHVAPSVSALVAQVGLSQSALLQHLAKLTAAGVDIAFSNGWRYGAPIPPGPVTMNDLWNMIPMNPPVSVVDVTGSEICALLEENLERTFAADPFDQMGGYVKRCRGLNLYIKVENPRGRRIDRLFAEGRPIEPEDLSGRLRHCSGRAEQVRPQPARSRHPRHRLPAATLPKKTPLRLGPQRTVMAV